MLRKHYRPAGVRGNLLFALFGQWIGIRGGLFFSLAYLEVVTNVHWVVVIPSLAPRTHRDLITKRSLKWEM